MYDELLTVSDAAKMLGISASTLRRLEENGEVKMYGLKVVYTPGGQRRYLADEIQRVYSQTGFAGKIGFGERPAILVRDITHAFIDEGSTLAIKTDIALDQLTTLLELAQRQRIPLIFTKTVYQQTHPFSKLWGKKFSSLKVLSSDAVLNQMDQAISHIPFDLVNESYYVSDFYDSNVEAFLSKNNIDTVILAGATASGSIRATAIEAFQQGLRVILPQEVIGDRTKSLLDFTLIDLNARYADVVPIAEVYAYLNQLSFAHSPAW